jgi:hypothetical protein
MIFSGAMIVRGRMESWVVLKTIPSCSSSRREICTASPEIGLKFCDNAMKFVEMMVSAPFVVYTRSQMMAVKCASKATRSDPTVDPIGATRQAACGTGL